ncbi:MAG: hypothetical protein Q7U04_17850 [Bacteriovorax sp.]|nr:hypothetical protein [Bacteriovorax sp.]
MFLSNILFQDSIKLILAMTILASCSASKIDKANEATTATFFVEKIEGSSVISKIDPEYLIPKTRLYNFKACIKDIMQSKAIQGQSFKVAGGESEKIINSDEQGCLNWSENINFNFLAPSNYVQLSRTIISNGIHKGSFKVQLVLNPWGHGEETSGVIDPTKQSVSTLINEKSALPALKSDGFKSPLWAIDSKVIIMQKEFTNSGASMILKFQSKISLILKNTISQNVQYQLNTGHFNVELQLYNSIIDNGIETLSTLASGIVSDAIFTQDTLMAELPFNLNALPNRGQILIAVKISAPDNQLGLAPFEGIFLVSDDYNIKTEKSVSILAQKSFNEVKMMLQKNQVQLEDKSTLAKPGIEIGKLDINFFKIGSENTTNRQVFFNIKACMKNNLDNKPIRNETFLIKTIADSKIIKLISNQDGCISWDDSIWHKFFGSEHFIKSSVTISNTNFNLNNSISILLNPWEAGSNFGRDSRFTDSLGSLGVNPSNENAKIVFENYSFQSLNYTYDINKNLDLSLIKNGSLSLSARVTKHSSLSDGRMASEILRDGQYLLKWAVVSLDGNQKIESVISTGQKLVTSVSGDVKTDISVRVAAFEKLGLKSRIIVALYTVKENKLKDKSTYAIDTTSGLEATPYIATIVLNNDQEGQKMTSLDSSLGLGSGDVFDRLSSLSKVRNLSRPLELVQTESTNAIMTKQNLKKINLANEKESFFLRDGLENPKKYAALSQNPAYYHEQVLEQRAPISTVTLTNFAKTGKISNELAIKFCSFWFNDYLRRIKSNSKTGVLPSYIIENMTLNCLEAVRKDPSRIFSVDKKLIVKKVGNIKYKKGTSSNLSVGNAFNVARAEATSLNKTWSWTTTAGLSFDLFDIFRIGTSGSYAVAKSDSKSTTTNNSVQVASTTNLLMQTSLFEVEISSYEECSSIRLNPNLFIGKNAQFSNIWNNTVKPEEIVSLATAGLFICTGVINNTPIIKEENYYLISQDNTYNRGEQDANAPENQTLFMTFRGQKDFSAFIGLIQGSLKRPETASAFEKSTSATKAGLTNDFLTKLPSWPGVYSDTIN